MKYTPVTSLHVLLSHNGKELPVGRLALKDRKIWFQYDASFLTQGLNISPFHLPLKPELIAGDPSIFDGLHGVFNDSLPDGWGQLLLERHVTKLGIDSGSLTMLDRLAYVGRQGMGALIYQPEYKPDNAGEANLNLDHLAEESHAVLEGGSKEMIEELLALNGSSQGARPKVMAGVSRDKKQIIHGTDSLPNGYEHWLIKFASSGDPKDIGAIEYAYSLMAKAAGLDMPETYLFPAKKGAGYFGVKRFDRDGDKRFHVHTVSGLLHANHRTPSLDYEGILKAGFILTKSMVEVEKLFRLAAFNVFARNRDDHAKNFSFIMESNGAWRFAPVYDLTYSSGPAGEHSTTIMGEGRALKREHLKRLAAKFDIKKADDIIDHVESAVSRWKEFAGEAGVLSRKLIN